jgi:hypothetical protein
MNEIEKSKNPESIHPDPWINIEKTTLDIVKTGAFGGRNSEELKSLQAELKTKLTLLGTSFKKNCSDFGAQGNQKIKRSDPETGKSSKAWEDVIYRRGLLKAVEEHWKKGRVGGLDVKEMRDMRNASLNELFDSVKEKK